MCEAAKTLTGYPSIDKPWLKYYSEEAINGELPSNSIYEYMAENNRGNEKTIALYYLGAKITYGELLGKIQEATDAFASLGIRPGEIVSVCLPSIPEAIYAIYAINRLGAIANMIHPLAGVSELITFFNEAHSRVVIMLDATYEAIKDSIVKTVIEKAVVVSVADSMPTVLRFIYRLKNRPATIDAPCVVGWRELLHTHGKSTLDLQNIHTCGDTDALIIHTGGTTGSPKGVVLTNRNINAILWQVKNTLAYEKTDKMLVVLPPFIGYGLCNGILEPLALGMGAVLIPKYEPKKIGEYLNRYRPQHMNSIPQYFEHFLSIPASQSLSHLGFVATGGDSMSTKLEEQLNVLFAERGASASVMKGYGCTEMVSCAAFTQQNCNAIGSVGIPLVKNNVKVIELGTENELRYEEEGEICLCGPSMMKEYLDNRKATDDLIHIHADGHRWLHTGDVGYITEDGLIYIIGRVKRIMITVGADGQPVKLFPDRIEKALLSHPSVSACVAVGQADVQRINLPVAYVKLNEKHSANILDELQQVCADNLPAYMMPTRFELVSDFPRTEIGKVDYRALEERAAK